MTDVAGVADEKASGNASVMDFPRQPMNSEIGSVAITKTAHTNFSVTATIYCCSPKPTGFRLGNVCPKAFQYWDLSPCCPHASRRWAGGMWNRSTSTERRKL